MFLSIGGVTIPVKYPDGAVKDEPIEIGDRGRSFAGAALTSVRAYKDAWTIVTRPISRAEADTILAELKAAPPRSMSGDLVSNVARNVVTKLLGEEIVNTALGIRFRLRFRIEEE